LCLGASLPQLDFCPLRGGANAGVAREGWARDFLGFDFRPLQGGMNGGVVQEHCSGATSYSGARSSPGAGAARRGA